MISQVTSHLEIHKLTSTQVCDSQIEKPQNMMRNLGILELVGVWNGQKKKKKKVKKGNRAEQEGCLLNLKTSSPQCVGVVFIMTNVTPLFLFEMDPGFDIFI